MVHPRLSPLLYLPVLGSGITLVTTAATAEPDLSSLPDLLKSISADIFPGLKAIAQDIHANPETSTREHHAHDTVVAYFTEQVPGLWDVTPHAYGEPTAFALDFTHKAPGYAAGADPLPAIGFMAEYDALLGIGHACGHNHILLNGLAAATAARQALVELGIPGRIRVLGTPDEENTAGKGRLLDKGAFDDGVVVWLMAHPTSANAVQPMQARVNAEAAFRADTHAGAVRAAYEALVAIVDLAGAGLPGTASSATPVEDVGMFSTNVVAQRIDFGIGGLGIDEVREAVAGLLDDTYPGVEYSVAASTDDVEGGGVNLTVTGPGGHASEGNKSPLRLTIETFRSLTESGKEEGISFFLPGNTTVTELGITTSVRTRYTADLDAVLAQVKTALLDHAADTVVTDRPYAALEVVRPLGDRFIALMRDADHDGSEASWGYSTTAPAATDAGLVEEPTLDPDTRELLSVRRALLHANYDICDRRAGVPAAEAPCGFNHEPEFERTAATEYSYTRTEIVARAQAQMAVEAIADESVMADFVSLVRK